MDAEREGDAMSFDWEPFRQAKGDLYEFGDEGDELKGKILNIRTHVFKEKEGPVVILDLERQDGGEVSLSCGFAQLRRQIVDIAPQVGDLIAVKFTGWESTPNGRMRVFEVRHRAAEKKAEPPPEPAYEPVEEPF